MLNGTWHYILILEMRHGCIHFEEIKHAFSTNWQISYSNLTFKQEKKSYCILLWYWLLGYWKQIISEIWLKYHICSNHDTPTIQASITKRKYNICKTYKSIPVYYMSDKCTLSLPRVRVQNTLQYHTFQILRSYTLFHWWC